MLEGVEIGGEFWHFDLDLAFLGWGGREVPSPARLSRDRERLRSSDRLLDGLGSSLSLLMISSYSIRTS